MNQGIQFSPSQPNVSIVNIDNDYRSPVGEKSQEYGLPSYEDALNMNKY